MLILLGFLPFAHVHHAEPCLLQVWFPAGPAGHVQCGIFVPALSRHLPPDDMCRILFLYKVVDPSQTLYFKVELTQLCRAFVAEPAEIVDIHSAYILYFIAVVAVLAGCEQLQSVVQRLHPHGEGVAFGQQCRYRPAVHHGRRVGEVDEVYQTPEFAKGAVKLLHHVFGSFGRCVALLYF